MQINIAPLFPLPDIWDDSVCAKLVYEFEGKRYYLSQWRQYILYRLASNPMVEHTLFMPGKNFPAFQPSDSIRAQKEMTPALLPETEFARQIQAGCSGRLALYACPQAWDCLAALFFRPDGTGTFYDCASNCQNAKDRSDGVPFSWKGNCYGISNVDDLLYCAWDNLLPLCENVFLNQVWPRMEEPYVSCTEYSDEPFRFISGSEEELNHITRCICHTDDVLYARENSGPVSVRYQAQTSKYEGGLYEPLGSESIVMGKRYLLDRLIISRCSNPRLKRLCTLAYEQNRFTGATLNWDNFGEPGLTRRQCYYLKPETLNFQIAPPSGHERTEAFLYLRNWLKDKVTEQELNQYLPAE